MQRIKNALLKIVEDIDTGNSNLTDKELLTAATMLRELARKDEPISKYEACKYLNMSRATFDNKVRAGEFPAGKKIAGLKEKVWYKRDLQTLLNESGSNSR